MDRLRQRARKLVTAGNSEAAIPLYQELAKADPNDPSPLVGLAIAQFKATRYRDAVASSTAALKLSPGLFPALLFLGASRVELGEYPGAVPPLEQAAATRQQPAMPSIVPLARDRYRIELSDTDVSGQARRMMAARRKPKPAKRPNGSGA